ncbi:MAG: EAL domain-containing protein [Ramlibacter sp.]
MDNSLMHEMDSGAGDDTVRDSRRDAGQVTVFAPGDGRVSAEELRALSPQQMLWRHKSVAGLSDELIMMVDDEMLNIEMTQAFLVEAGYRRFVHTDQPQNAIAMMRKQLPAVLLLDLSMPKVSGLDILDAMRSHRSLRHVPVIVLTSSMDPQVRLKALSLGAMDFLSKPVDPSELGLRIRNTLAASAYRDYLSEHDALTGLPNKQRFQADMAEVLAAARASGTEGALLHVGVDALGRINDALGRIVGDQLLQRVAKRLASCVQTEAGGELSSEQHNPTLYRLDGDEFAIVVPRMDGVPGAAAFISKLLEDAGVRFQRPGSPEVFVTCSIGVSVFPVDGMTPDMLMRNAGLALRHAKQAGTHRYEFFSRRFNEQAQSRLDLSAELRHAVGRDEVELVYEPRVDLATGRVTGAHSLLRWKHASGRVIQGDELMELAGSSEMDVALTEWSFEQMRKHVTTWRAAGLQCVPVAMTASLANMRPSDVARLVNAVLAGDLQPRDLLLVLGQVRAIEHLPAPEAAAIAVLRRSGVRVALDRFGCVASVAHVRKLMCDELRLDASLARDLETDATSRAILLSMGDLARRLQVACIACGIESTEQLAFLM